MNIKERLDFSCAVFDDQGRLLANAPHMPVHLGAMGESVRTVLESRGPTLKPGDMIAVDTENGELIKPQEIDERLASRAPYKQWLKKNARMLESRLADTRDEAWMERDQVKTYEKLFHVSFEERDQVLRPTAEAGQEAVGSMGDDTPFAVLSERERPLYDYFRQVFAQVTNPPIDPLREQIVMSLECCLGAERSIFEETPERASRLLVDSPVLSEGKFHELLAIKDVQYGLSR